MLHPDTTWARWRSDLNDDSVVLLLRFGRFEAVLAGDLGVRAESLLAGKVGSVDLLKVGHHGSAGSTGAPWLAELRSQGGSGERRSQPLRSSRAARHWRGWPTREPRSGAPIAKAASRVTVQETTMVVRDVAATRTYGIRP